MGDVSSIVCTLMCGYYKAIEDYILECQRVMKVLLFNMMLVLMYMLYCVDIAK
jgi:hypothetical protein